MQAISLPRLFSCRIRRLVGSPELEINRSRTLPRGNQGGKTALRIADTDTSGSSILATDWSVIESRDGLRTIG